jgi:hypothetical protein
MQNQMNKPYLLIAGDNYYPDSGTKDWKGTYATYEEAEAALKDIEYDWYEIVDLMLWIKNN